MWGGGSAALSNSDSDYHFAPENQVCYFKTDAESLDKRVRVKRGQSAIVHSINRAAGSMLCQVDAKLYEFRICDADIREQGSGMGGKYF